MVKQKTKAPVDPSMIADMHEIKTRFTKEVIAHPERYGTDPRAPLVFVKDGLGYRIEMIGKAFTVAPVLDCTGSYNRNFQIYNADLTPMLLPSLPVLNVNEVAYLLTECFEVPHE